MKLAKEINFDLFEFQTWGGATYWKERILEEGEVDLFNEYIEEWAMVEGELSPTQINDLLWHYPEMVARIVGLEEEWADMF